MGKRGPRPAPTALRVLRGEPHQDRINREEPLPADGLPEPPEGLSEEAFEVWHYTVGQLAAMGTASAADRDALVCYCEAVVQHRKASALLAKSSVLLKGRGEGKWVRNPLVQIQRDAAVLIRAFAQEFGLTPSARSEIRTGRSGSEGRADGLGPDRLLS